MGSHQCSYRCLWDHTNPSTGNVYGIIAPPLSWGHLKFCCWKCVQGLVQLLPHLPALCGAKVCSAKCTGGVLPLTGCSEIWEDCCIPEREEGIFLSCLEDFLSCLEDFFLIILSFFLFMILKVKYINIDLFARGVFTSEGGWTWIMRCFSSQRLPDNPAFISFLLHCCLHSPPLLEKLCCRMWDAAQVFWISG